MEIVKICIHHGELTEENVRRYVRNRRGRAEPVIACKICHNLTCGRARALNRDKANEWARNDRKNNPDKYREQSKNYKKKNWQKISVGESLRKLGITNEQYNNMLLVQDNKCAICYQYETRKSRTEGNICRMAIDHCHTTNKVRGLLCHACNLGIGYFKDDASLLKKAISYLENHEH